jgi:hypothetical protein
MASAAGLAAQGVRGYWHGARFLEMNEASQLGYAVGATDMLDAVTSYLAQSEATYADDHKELARRASCLSDRGVNAGALLWTARGLISAEADKTTQAAATILTRACDVRGQE